MSKAEEIKSFEVYCRDFSQVVQCDSIVSAIVLFRKENPTKEVITVENIEARTESYASSKRGMKWVKQKIEERFPPTYEDNEVIIDDAWYKPKHIGAEFGYLLSQTRIEELEKQNNNLMGYAEYVKRILAKGEKPMIYDAYK